MAPHTSYTRFLPVSFFVFCLILAGLFFVSRALSRRAIPARVSQTHTIELRDDGFYPPTLSVNTGDTVTFTTIRGKPFWPASDLHPTHTLYPEFDPKQPIAPNASWSFAFTKVGSWKYHDHLAPLYRGVVVAGEESALAPSSAATRPCDEKAKSEMKSSCWSDAIQKAVRQGGVAAAFDVFNALYTRELDFAQNCHSFTHLIGQEAYYRFHEGKDLRLTSQIAYCSYGFFHGFIETMMQKEGSLAGAHDFCVRVGKELSGELYTLGPCFHGIGHGITDGSDPRTKGDAARLVQKSLALCRRVGGTPYETKMCATGVFNSLAIMYLDEGTYHFGLNRNDPYAFCRTVEDTLFKEACYEDFKIIPMGIENNNFARAVHYADAISDTHFASAAVDTIASFAVYFLLRDTQLLDNAVSACYSLEQRLWGSCVAGLGAGILGQGRPNEEYVQALALCASLHVHTGEKDACYERVGKLIPLRYPTGKAQQICMTLDAKYRQLCMKPGL